ncbi:MAG: hypothetical protein HYW80_00775, partial [Parcubacteria group bacterium]|nr:hypothetical protein [Parcubacteria group bacterium]
KYPPNLQETKEGFIDEAYLTTVTYCEGKNENTPAIAPEGIPERCDGTEYRIDVRVYKESLDPKTVTKYYDANPYPYEIKKIAINGKDFYIGLQAVYTYSGWYVHTAVQENTLELAFSGNGYVKPATSDTTISQEELEKIIPILASLRVRK